MKRLLYLAAALSAAFLCGCKREPDPDEAYKALAALEFTSSDEDFPNPERGFYRPVEFHGAAPTAFAATTVTSLRQFNYTLMLLEFYLTDFMESDISEQYLEGISSCFENLREGGGKAIVRFAYKDSESDKPWDASEAWVLRHIEQVKPILQENADVILVLQAGFIGVWGEWYYTSNFNMNPVSEASFTPRKHVLEALLDALPERRQVQLRTPEFKLKLLGLSVTDTLTSATAHSPAAVSRVGGHNDCFLASSNDTGTFHGDTEREFWKADSRYTIMGGESCKISSYCKCDNAIKALEDYHWTYLNSAFHTGVLSIWRTDKCFDEISRRLGYRLSIDKAFISPTVKAGEPVRLVLKMRNDGFSAPQNPRLAQLVFTGADGTSSAVTLDKVDPRTWYAGTVTTVDVTVPAPEKAGEYTLSLNLPDPEPALFSNPFYSIRLANQDVWDELSGYNKITTVSVE